MLDNVDNNEGVDRKIKDFTKDESKCPFKKNFEIIHEDKNEEKAVKIENKLGEGFDTTVTQNRSITKCPYNLLINNSTTLNYTKHNTSSDENEHILTGGCPMLNKIRKEPEENFSFYYEIPYESPYDLIFKIKGTMNKADFYQKTTKLRSMPRHLRFSLFYLKEEKLVNLKKKEFPDIYFAYEELREKAYNHYSMKEFKQAIKYYILTYSLFKWLEFKDGSRDKDILNSQSDSLPILDNDIEEKRLHFKKDDEIDISNFEEGCYKTCLTTILKHLSLCYMHQRHYSEAIVCLNEAINYSNDKVPELYLRRSQTRTYNKFSTIEHLNQALKDINKAIELDENEPRFLIHLKILNDLIEEKSSKEIERTEKLIHNAKYSFHKINDKKLNLNDYVYSSYDHIETNSKVLDEMLDKYKNTFKFHNETNNQKQITLAYKEIEEFSDIYYKFKWYYLFDLNNISEDVSRSLDYEDK